MKNKKKLLAIHLNEFNYEYLKYGSKKYKLRFLKKLVSLKKLEHSPKIKLKIKIWIRGFKVSL